MKIKLVEATVEAPGMSRNWFPLLVEINPFLIRKRSKQMGKTPPFFFFLPVKSLLPDYWKSVFSKSQEWNAASLESPLTGPMLPLQWRHTCSKWLFATRLPISPTPAGSSRILLFFPAVSELPQWDAQLIPSAHRSAMLCLCLLLLINSFGHVSWTRNGPGSNGGLHHRLHGWLRSMS